MKKILIIILVVLVVVVTGVVLWNFYGPKIPVDRAGNIVMEVPENVSLKDDIFTSILSNLEQGTLVGQASFVAGDHPLPVSGEIYQLRIPHEGATVEFSVDFGCEAETATAGKVMLKPLVREISFHFSPRIGIATPQGLQVEIEQIAFSDNDDRQAVTVSTDVKVGESLASFFLYLFITPSQAASGGTSTEWLSLFREISVATCRLAVREQAVIPFNKNSIVAGKPCEIVLSDFQLQNDQNLRGTVSVNLTLAQESVFDLGDVLVRPEEGSIAFTGLFSMRDGLLSVTVNEQTDRNFILIRNARVRERGSETDPIIASPEGGRKNRQQKAPANHDLSPGKKTTAASSRKILQGNSPADSPGKKSMVVDKESSSGNDMRIDIAEARFRLVRYEFSSDPEKKQDRTDLEVLSSLTTKNGSIPLDRGKLSFSSLKIPEFSLTIHEDSAVPGSGSTLILPTLTFNNATVLLEQSSDESVAIDLTKLESRNVEIKGWQDGRLTLDTTKLAIKRIVYRRKKETIQVLMGPKSRIELGKNNLQFLLNPSKTKKKGPQTENQGLVGDMHIRGVLPSLATHIAGSDFQLDRITADLQVNIDKQFSLAGTVTTDIPAATIAASLAHVPPPDVKDMKFDQPSFTNVGAMKLAAQLKIIGDANNSRIDLSMPQVTDILLTGKALRNSDINLQAFCSAFQATAYMGKETGHFSLTLALKNNISSCIHEEKVKILTGSAKEKFYLEPFEKIFIDVQGDITMENNSLVIKPKTWQQTNDQEVVIKASGDVGSHRLSATLKDNKTSCQVFGIDLPESICPGNMLRDELNKLCKKEFVIKL